LGGTGFLWPPGVALIERASALGALDSSGLFRSAAEARQFLVSIERGDMPIMPQRLGTSTVMPSQEPERTAEAVRRALPYLASLIVTNPELPRGATTRFRAIARSR